MQSQNTKVDFVIPATSFIGLSSYGKVMIGDRAFEFYNDTNPKDYIQIPWNEIECIYASVVFNKKITRFGIQTKNAGQLKFSTRDNKATLRACLPYVPADRLVRSLSFVQVIKAGLHSLNIFSRKGEK